MGQLFHGQPGARLDVIGVIMLVSSAREMVKSMNTVRENMLMIYAAVVLAALLSGMIFTRVITKPIGELTAVIRQMSKGTFSARVPEHGSGEIRQLASAFNSMSEAGNAGSIAQSVCIQRQP